MLPVDIFDPCVVPGRDEVGPEAKRMVKERLELDFLVTHDVRVQRPSETVLGQEVFEHAVPIFFFEVDRVIRDSDLVGDRDDVFIVFRRRTDTVLVRIIPVFHKDPDDVIPLLFEQMGRHRRIDAA